MKRTILEVILATLVLIGIFSLAIYISNRYEEQRQERLIVNAISNGFKIAKP